MSDRDNDSGESRLSRWSRLKTQAKAEQDISALPEALADGEPGSQVPVTTADGLEESSLVLEDLPDIETLDKDSDFTPFLNVNVPDQLRRLALKKLWASDPVFANLDGLNDYDEDYSTLGMIAEKVSSVFKLGEGMRGAEPEQIQSDPDDPQQSAGEVAESSEEPEADSDDVGTDELDMPEADATVSAQDSDELDDSEEPTA